MQERVMKNTNKQVENSSKLLISQVIHAAAESRVEDEKKLKVLKYLIEQFSVEVDCTGYIESL